VGVDASWPKDRQAKVRHPDHTLRVWDLAAGKQHASFLGHSACAFSPDGRRVAVIQTALPKGEEAGMLRTWDLTARRETSARRTSFCRSYSSLRLFRFTADGRTIAVGLEAAVFRAGGVS